MQFSSLYDLFEQIPNEKAAARFFEQHRWPDGRCCPKCGSKNTMRVQNVKPMPFRCRTCRKHFSVRTETLMANSRLALRKWILAIYLMHTSRMGISSVEMAKKIGTTQKTAWSLGHRIRAAMVSDDEMLSGIVEADETYIGGIETKKHRRKKLGIGSGTSGKQPVMGMRQRNGEIRAFLLDNELKKTLQDAVRANVASGSSLYTDALSSYQGMLEYRHAYVSHQKGEYVRGDVHTNSIESFWAVLKRGYRGVYHFMSFKHLGRYVSEFVYRFNVGVDNSLDTIGKLIPRMVGKCLTYAELKGEGGVKRQQKAI